ncbi:hypothetical protein [Flagellimonas flava]|uniref:hypothetical protein n=1 Tax=Flagellimonas flava TaxID=570519 RepID=UPI003D6494D3
MAQRNFGKRVKTWAALLGFMALVGCSKDAEISPDAILGEWLTVGRETKSGVPDEISFCEARIYREFNTDGSMVAKWTTGDAPTECADLSLSTLKWKNIGNNRWELGTGVLVLGILRLEGNRMVEENQDNDWVYFYERR